MEKFSLNVRESRLSFIDFSVLISTREVSSVFKGTSRIRRGKLSQPWRGGGYAAAVMCA